MCRINNLDLKRTYRRIDSPSINKKEMLREVYNYAASEFFFASNAPINTNATAICWVRKCLDCKLGQYSSNINGERYLNRLSGNASNWLWAWQVFPRGFQKALSLGFIFEKKEQAFINGRFNFDAFKRYLSSSNDIKISKISPYLNEEYFHNIILNSTTSTLIFGSKYYDIEVPYPPLISSHRNNVAQSRAYFHSISTDNYPSVSSIIVHSQSSKNQSTTSISPPFQNQNAAQLASELSSKSEKKTPYIPIETKQLRENYFPQPLSTPSQSSPSSAIGQIHYLTPAVSIERPSCFLYFNNFDENSINILFDNLENTNNARTKIEIKQAGPPWDVWKLKYVLIEFLEYLIKKYCEKQQLNQHLSELKADPKQFNIEVQTKILISLKYEIAEKNIETKETILDFVGEIIRKNGQIFFTVEIHKKKLILEKV